MTRSAFLAPLVLLISAFAGSAQDKAEAVDPKVLRESPQKFENKTVVVKDMGLLPDGVHLLDKKEGLYGLTLVHGSNDYYFGKILNPEGITFVVSSGLTGKLQQQLQKGGAKLHQLDLTCKVQKRGKFWVAEVSQIDVTGVGNRRINSIRIK